MLKLWSSEAQSDPKLEIFDVTFLCKTQLVIFIAVCRISSCYFCHSQ